MKNNQKEKNKYRKKEFKMKLKEIDQFSKKKNKIG